MKVKFREVPTYLKVLIIIDILLLIFIWGHSCMPGELSTHESGLFKTFIAAPVIRFFTGNTDISDFFIRKSGHVIEYFVLGIFICITVNLWANYLIKNKVIKKFKCKFVGMRFILSVCICILVAAIDETIQAFSIDRGAQLSDVILDSTSSLVAISIVSIIIFLFNLNNRVIKK